jgi:hypothetical protein
MIGSEFVAFNHIMFGDWTSKRDAAQQPYLYVWAAVPDHPSPRSPQRSLELLFHRQNLLPGTEISL